MRNFSLNKAKKEKKNFFCGKFGSIPTFRSTRKGKNVFVMSLHLSDNKVLHNIASVLIKFFSISLGFARFFRSYFVLPNFWS